MIFIIILILFVIWYYYGYDNSEGFHGGHFRRFPHMIRYDPSMYYDETPSWYESPYVFYNQPPRFDRGRKNQSYWDCFELNKASGASNSDAYKLCSLYID
jgi:hypothetical protein